MKIKPRIKNGKIYGTFYYDGQVKWYEPAKIVLSIDKSWRYR